MIEFRGVFKYSRDGSSMKNGLVCMGDYCLD